MADARSDASLTFAYDSMRRRSFLPSRIFVFVLIVICRQIEKGRYHETLETLIDSLNALLDEKAILEKQLKDTPSPTTSSPYRSIASYAIEKQISIGKRSRLSDIDAVIQQIQEELSRITAPSQISKSKLTSDKQRRAAEKKEKQRIAQIHRNTVIDLSCVTSYLSLLSICPAKPFFAASLPSSLSSSSSLSPSPSSSSPFLVPDSSSSSNSSSLLSSSCLSSPSVTISTFCLFANPSLFSVATIGGFDARFGLIASRASHINPLVKQVDGGIGVLRKKYAHTIGEFLHLKASLRLKKRKKRKGEGKLLLHFLFISLIIYFSFFH
jgi:hypothetical protein